MADTTATTVAELIQATIEQARFTLSQGVNLANLIKKKKNKGAVSFPKWDEEAFASVAEGTDLTATAFDTTEVTVTPGENGLMADLTDIAAGRASQDVAAGIGKVMGEARLNLLNQDIYALFDGFSRSIGTTNTNITESLIIDGVALLRSGKAPGPYFMPVTPWVYADLLKLYSSNTDTRADELARSAQIKGVLREIHGVFPVLIDNLAAGTSTGEADEADTKTAIFSASAFGYVEEWDFRIEPDRNASKRSTELVATASYGVAEINDLYGVELLLDNKD